MDQDPEDLADLAKIREEVIRLREIVVPEWKPEQSLRSKFFAVFKWPLCWIVGIGLVTILILNLDKDPFVIGQQTMKIEEIPFASIGITPQGAIEADYYENFERFVHKKVREKKIFSIEYKNWNYSTAHKLATIIYQLCNIRKTYLEIVEVPDYKEHSPILNQFWFKKVETFDIMTDQELKDDVVPNLKKSLTNCSETVRLITWKNELNSLKNIEFNEIITDGGITCVTNSRSAFISQRNGTLRHSLGFIPTFKNIEMWKQVNFDKPINGNDAHFKTPLLIQKRPGNEFGMSFIVQEERENVKCTGNDGEGFRLTLTHPRELHRVRQEGRILQYGYEHFVKIEPVGRFLDFEVTNSQEICCLENECGSETNSGLYSQSECFETCIEQYSFENCNCTTIDSYSAGRKLCDVDEYFCYFYNFEKLSNSRNKLCQHCKPSCNDVRYLVEITSVPLAARILTQMQSKLSHRNSTDFAVVHVFYGVGTFEVTMTKLRRLFTELIGITTGMFGSAVEITLPKILDFCFILFGILATALALCWRKSQPCRRRIRAMLTKARRLFHSRQIEPDVSIIPMQILVTSRTNLTNSEENGEHFE